MTNLKIDYNLKPITKVESGDFFTDNDNHLYYCIEKGKIVDLSINEYFDCTKEEYMFYHENNYVRIHNKLEIKIIE